MTRVYAVSAAVLAAVFLGAIAYFVLFGRGGGDAFAQCRDAGITVAGDTIGGPFEMVDHTGRSVTDADVITRPSLLYFGYTFCPDVCPIDVDRNAIATDIAQERGYDVQPVFLTVDPRRDTVEVLGNFVSNMHPDMIGLTGSEEQVRKAAQAYRAFYRAQDPGDDPYYLVDHSTFSYFVLPEHGFVDVFRRDMAPDALAERMACFIDAS
ncbi:SCO family protein [Alkalilacustris brevis]|uniref:SCO family protein n=1 Tax=Alkalilacustris brevis TaxID=2026338 RepID=UPI000E0D689D|nr:SCO family protein [Alkalilacustris brevis]